MRYISTRGQAPPVSFLDAVLAGMAPDGGLYVPEQIPALQAPSPSIAIGHFGGVAMRVLERFAGGDLPPGDEAIPDITNKAFIDAPTDPRDKTWRAKWPEAVTPLRQTGVAD